MGMLAALIGNGRPQSVSGLLTALDTGFNELILELEEKNMSWMVSWRKGGVSEGALTIRPSPSMRMATYGFRFCERGFR